MEVNKDNTLEYESIEDFLCETDESSLNEEVPPDDSNEDCKKKLVHTDAKMKMWMKAKYDDSTDSLSDNISDFESIDAFLK